MSERKILDITPLDPDIVVITDWLAGELGPEEMAATEQRLRDDDAFFMKAGPIVKLWNLPVKYETLLAQHATEAKPVSAATAPAASEWARATAAAIVRGVEAEPLPASAPATMSKTARVAAKVVPSAKLPVGERIFRFWFRGAGDTKPPGPGRYLARIRYAYVTLFLLAFGIDRRVNAPEPAIEKSEFLSTLWTRVEQGLALTALAAVVLMLPLGAYSAYRDADDSSLIRRAVHVVTRPPLRGGAKVQTQSGQEAPVILAGGTRATVRGASTLEWNPEGMVLLRGSATFEVPADVREFRVLTSYGDVRMGPGKYAFGRSGDGKLVLISVAAGLARVRADTAATADSATVNVGPGEFAELSSQGLAVKVNPNLATEHPNFTRERVVYRPRGVPGSVERWRQFSWIRVAPGSRLTWAAGNQALLHLTGEMAMVLDPRDGSTLVQTDFGDVPLNAGSHALKTVADSGQTPVILVSSRGQPPRIAPRAPHGSATPTEAIVEWLGFESGRVRTRDFVASDYPGLIPDSLAPRTPFAGARGSRK